MWEKILKVPTRRVGERFNQLPVGGKIGPPGLIMGGRRVDDASGVLTAVSEDTLRPSKNPWMGPVGGFNVGSWITLEGRGLSEYITGVDG